MSEKTILIYDLKDKTNTERSKILKKLYGYRDKSNYNYEYQRKGFLDDFDIEKKTKTVLRIKNKRDIPKIVEFLEKLNVDVEIAKH